MLDTIEKRMVQDLPITASKSVAEGLLQEGSSTQGKLFLKVLYNYLQRPTPFVSSELVKILGKSDISPKELQEQMMAMFSHMVLTGVEPRSHIKKYTTGQLSAMFGVTVATINNWLKDGKIIGAEKKGMHKQYRIPETAIYMSASGEDIPIKEIAKLYEEEQKRTSIKAMTPTQEQKELLDAIVFYEKKYGGEYQNALGKRKETELTSLEKRDAEEWQYLLKCINGENG